LRTGPRTSRRSNVRRSSRAGFAATAGASRLRNSRKIAAEVERHARELARTVDDIVELGVEVKDLDEGLVDFPALRRGETVLLCWRLG